MILESKKIGGKWEGIIYVGNFMYQEDWKMQYLDFK